MAAYVSTVNDCPFCIGGHTATASLAARDEVMLAAVLADLESAPVGEGLQATLRMIGKLTRGGQISAEDMRAVLETGVSRQQIDATLSITYAFNVTNRLANAFDFEVMNPEGIQAGAKIPTPARLPLVVSGRRRGQRLEWTPMDLPQRLRNRARALKRDAYALYLVARHPRTPWYAKLLAGAVVAYALSPFDLIPDFIPVLGYLDDLILVPAGVALVLRLVPAEVLAECRERADRMVDRPVSRVGAAVIIGVWLAVAIWALLFLHGLLD